MKTERKILLRVSVLCLLCGCTITQTARPVSLQGGDSREMCVIDDPRVDETFLPAPTKGHSNRKGSPWLFFSRVRPSGHAH